MDAVFENDYNQLNQRLSGEIAAQQVHITRLQGAIKVAVNSELLFPSGGWQMPPDAAQTIAKMAPILARSSRPRSLLPAIRTTCRSALSCERKGSKTISSSR